MNRIIGEKSIISYQGLHVCILDTPRLKGRRKNHIVSCSNGWFNFTYAIVIKINDHYGRACNKYINSCKITPWVRSRRGLLSLFVLTLPG